MKNAVTLRSILSIIEKEGNTSIIIQCNSLKFKNELKSSIIEFILNDNILDKRVKVLRPFSENRILIELI